MLFDEISDINFLINNMNKLKNTNNNSKLVNDSIGLQRGNMFNNEYKPYRNYKEEIIQALTEKDTLKLKLCETYFALIDLGLYLDLHPEDNDVFERFQNCLSEYEKYKDVYEKQYGPLELTCVKGNSYDWINNPWPWDKDGGTKYV